MSPELCPVDVVGIGSTPFYKRGTAPRGQMGLLVEAVLAACADAGVDPTAIDGTCSYGHDLNEGTMLAAQLGFEELRWSTIAFGGGGGSVAGAVAHATAALQTRQADVAVVYRASAERSVGRLGEAVSAGHMNAHYRAQGVVSAAQICALRTRRLIEVDDVPAETMQALARASYHHARANPAAVGRDTVLDEATYLASRAIVDPYRLYDCSRENDGAGALVLMRAEDSTAPADRRARVLFAGQSSPRDWGEQWENDAAFTSAGFRSLARRLWAATGLEPSSIDTVQLYENFTGAALAALIDFGFCTPRTAPEVITYENLLAPHGELPLNTAGGNIAEGFVHGIGLLIEAVRQIRGESPNQVPRARNSLVIGGPIDAFPSAAVIGRSE